MAGKLAIHIAPEANPENVTQLIGATARDGRTFSSVNELLTYADDLGIGSRTEMQSTAVFMGLLKYDGDELGLSHDGEAFVQLRENVQPDILHFLMYSGWREEQPTNFLPSWAYRLCCDAYWQLSTTILSAEFLDRQVTEVINHAETTFLDLQVGEFDGISFSRKSLLGTRKWLEPLRPPVIKDNMFTRRDFCPPELLLLAIGYVMRDELDVIDVDILLSHSRREEICRVCLLDPAAFEETLEWMIPLFPHVIASTEDAGYYGRYIRLYKRPTLEDIVR